MECFLCKIRAKKDRRTTEEVKPFDPDILKSCDTFLQARKFHKHKYCDAVLPLNCLSEDIGYHSSCYKDFMVKKKYLLHER